MKLNPFKLPFKYSYRTKILVIIGTAIVIACSALMYLTVNMVYNDKKAYLYDATRSSSGSSYSAFEQFVSSKKQQANTYTSIGSDSFQKLQPAFNEDQDLDQVIVASPEALNLFHEEAKAKKTIHLDWDEKAADRWTEYEYLQHTELFPTVYKNKHLFKRYKKRLSFLLVKKQFLADLLSLALNNPGEVVSKLYFTEGRSPRLLFAIYDKQKQLLYCYNYILDFFMENIFSKFSHELTMVSDQGEIVLANKPEAQVKNAGAFYKAFLSNRNTKNADVRETAIDRVKYIMTSRELSEFPGYHLISAVKTEEAYEVTYLLILNTLIYGILLIAVFNIIAVLLARSLTGPLDDLIQVIARIGAGDYTTRAKPQRVIELDVVGECFNTMVSKIQLYHQKLEEANQTLERKVIERTESLRKANDSIQTMVNSLDQGLVVFNQDGVCSDLHTKASEHLLKVNPSGKNIGEILKVQDRELFHEWLRSLFEELIPFESLLELGPSSLMTTPDYKSEKFQFVTLNFFPIRGKDQVVENVVMVATDETREFLAKKAAEAERKYIKLISRVLQDKKGFLRFLEAMEATVEQLANFQAETEESKSTFLRALHTLKGGAGFFALEDLVEKLHEFETFFADGIQEPSQQVAMSQELRDQITFVRNRLQMFIGAATSKTLEVSELDLRRFKDLCYSFNSELSKEFYERFLLQPVSKYVEQYGQLIEELSARKGKMIRPLEIQNGLLKVDSSYFQPFFDSCIHLFRNAVEHGIESPEERVNVGKPQIGTIAVSFELEKIEAMKVLVFKVSDDGRGIDPDKIRNKLREKEVDVKVLEESDDRIIHHIFDPSFSTAETVSEISGRGIGLYDVKEQLARYGGTLDIHSRPGEGSIFKFYLPIPFHT